VHQQAQKRQQEAAETQRAEVNAEVAASGTSQRLVSLLAEHGSRVSVDACRSAWRYLVQDEAVEPSHDIVTASGSMHMVLLGGMGDMGRKWHEADRASVWHAPNVPAPCEMGVWLDADGNAFQNGGGGAAGPSRSLFLPTTKVLVDIGAPLQISPWLGSLGPIQLVSGHHRDVEGGFTLYPCEPDGSAYAQIIRDVLAD
jgi:hypothetical protein